MTDQEKTIAKIEQTMRSWIEEQIPVYEQMPAAQQVTNTNGEKVLKANPATQEIRAAFRDYCYVVRVQRDMVDEVSEPATSIEDLRKRFKVAK